MVDRLVVVVSLPHINVYMKSNFIPQMFTSLYV